ncbi:hypothetical protein Ac2012v2_007257 [Leucoagaricus gongylophorus]
MANVIHDTNEKLSAAKASLDNSVGDLAATPAQQPTFNILPYPAKSNDPADMQKPSENTGGLRSSAFKATPGPVMLDQGMLNNLGPAKTAKELEVLQAELNRKS